MVNSKNNSSSLASTQALPTNGIESSLKVLLGSNVPPPPIASHDFPAPPYSNVIKMGGGASKSPLQDMRLPQAGPQ